MNKVAKINIILWISLFTLIQLFSVNVESNLKLYIIIAVTIILGLTSLLVNQKKFSYLFALICILLLLDSMLGFGSGINANTKTWIEQAVILSCAYLYAINLAIVISEEKNLNLFAINVIGLSIIILLTGIYEFFYLGTQPGRIITGYQNISSAIILASVPLFLDIKKINKALRLIYIIICFAVIIFLFKSRLIALVGLLYLIYLLYKNINIRLIYKLSSFALILIAVYLIFDKVDRFSNLLTGNDIWLRLFIWERLIIGGMDNFIFGSGFGKISIVSNSWQYVNPGIELIIGLNTFHSAHNDLIEKFVYGGILSLTIHIFINGAIFFGYFKYRKYKEEKVFLVYIFLFIASLVDVHNGNFPSLIFFHCVQLYLIIKIYEGERGREFFLKLVSLGLLIPGVYFIFFNKNTVDHVKYYQNISNEMIRGLTNNDRISQFDQLAPHFMRLDFIKMQTYLIYNSGQNFNKNYFEGLLLDTQKYNKYFIPQIQVSSQYYSFTNNEDKYLNVLHDFLYVSAFNQKFINISLNGEDVKVVISKQNQVQITKEDNKLTMSIPAYLFEQLKLVNSSFGKHRLSQELIAKEIDSVVYIGSGDILSAKEVLKNFLNGINQLSERFVF
jgi:hypothetical protein